MKQITFAALLFFLTSFAFSQEKTYQLSSHILDISKGAPASGVTIKLEKQNPDTKKWFFIDEKTTDVNGRIGDFLNSANDNLGIYKLTYLVSDYFKKSNTETFYPFIEVVFEIKDKKQHYHVPITLSAFGYSTYRGN
ncbi:hydroxyisourate hydrolase [Pedobacter arcticus]|uniref:hydroxyisourate hydrolase n=1 Tax=Pedobacter arcticus TaxID=752140 RepID=UPI00035CDA16|nr:hydroxyisourate hydrolase [Pedobacter arcticus]